jgi:hypothetical protein
LEKDIGVIKKEKSKLKHILGLEHGNISIQMNFWWNEVIFREKGQTTLYGYPDQIKLIIIPIKLYY